MIKHQSKNAIINFQNTVKKLLHNNVLLKVVPLSLSAWAIQSFRLVVITNALGFEGNIWFIMGIYNVSLLACAISFILEDICAT